jgi:putative oxidoreductase
MTQPQPAPLSPVALQGNTAFPTSVALLFLRLVLGWTFIYHGCQLSFGAFGGPGISGMAGMLAKQNLPLLPPTVWACIAAYGQLLGGITIALGFLTRLGTLPILACMFVAIANVHAPHGFSSQNGGYEYNLNLIADSLLLLLTGPGLISLDALIFPKNLWARGPQPLNQPTPRA